LQEPDRQEVIELITELSKRNTQVLVPSLFLYEVLSIAATNSFSIKAPHLLIKQYQSANLSIVELDQPAILKAIEICEQKHEKSGFPSFYDASYPALAITKRISDIWLKQKGLVM